MFSVLKNFSRNLPVAVAMSIVGYLAGTVRSEALQLVTNDDGCKVWNNDLGQPLFRKSGTHLMLRMPCGFGIGATASEHYTTHRSGQSIIMNDETEGAIATYQWDGGTGLIQTSRRLVGAPKLASPNGHSVSE